MFLLLAAGAAGAESVSSPDYREQLVHFLGVSMVNDVRQDGTGVVGELVVRLSKRRDAGGMVITFLPGQGTFSEETEVEIIQAIDRTARFAHLNTDSWNVSLKVAQPAVLIYGNSLSAMVGLSVVALAKGDYVPPDRVVTGTVTADGRLGQVRAISKKVQAAHREHLRRVIIPDTLDPEDPDWRTPFMMQVSPIHSVPMAYQALTDQPMSAKDEAATRPSVAAK